MTSASSFKWFKELEERMTETLQRVENADQRIKQLEKHIHYPHSETAMKEAAAKAQAQTVINEAYPPPMRADTEAILTLTKFAKRLLNPEDLGHAVTFEVRQLARRALGLP